jgi:hypothetical protein
MSSPTKYYSTGDVIVLYVPHKEDNTIGEDRWAICLEDLGDEIIMVPLTKKTLQKKRNPKSFIIKKDSDEGKSMKLLYDSLVLVNRASRKRKLIAIKHGYCPEKLIDKLHKLVDVD